MTLGDQSRVKMWSFLHHVLLSWMFLVVVSFVNCKPIVTSTPGSATITKSVALSGPQHVVDIALPVSLTNTEDLIAWATYAVRLMASKINVTVSPKKNETKSLMGTGMFPKMGAMMERLKSYMAPKPSPTKPTIFHKANKSSVNAEKKADTRGSDSASASSVLTRSIELYPNVPVGSVILDQLSPFIRYAPGVLSPVYEQSGSRVYPQHAIFPGIGFLPLNNKENPFANRPTTSSPREPSTARTTQTESTTMDAETIQGLNAALTAETEVTTSGSLITVPFEAYITITREQEANVPPAQSESTTRVPQTVQPEGVIVDSYSTINNQKPDDYFTTTSRDPPDEFPPFFNKTSDKLMEKNTKVKVVFEDEDSTTPKSEKKKKVTKKKKAKSSQKKKKNGIMEMIMRMIERTKKKNSTMNSNDVAPIIRIIMERNEKLKKQKSSKKKTRIQNVAAEDEVDDYDDEKLGENDSDENDDSLNETGSKGSQEEDDDDDDDDEDEEEEEPTGSLQPVLDLLPFIVPVLEDLSDPNTETDLAGIITAAVPLIQGLLEGDGDTPGLNIGGTIGPILASLSEGPDGQGSDVGAILGPILTLIAPLIGPIIGPLIGPTLRLSSNPPDKGFSLGALINSVAAPLSQPTDPWGLSPFASLVTQIVSGLSEELENELLGLDVGGLLNSVVMGLIAGTSAGLSGGSSGTHGAAAPPAYGPAPVPYGQVGSSTNYGNTYGNKVVPANTVNPLQLIGMSVQDILNAGVSVISSLITAVTGLSGASSAHDSGQSYGPPPSYAAQSQNIQRPRKSASAT